MLVAVDKFIKWIEVKFIKKFDVFTVIKFIRDIIVKFGVSYSIIIDNGMNFDSDRFKGFCIG